MMRGVLPLVAAAFSATLASAQNGSLPLVTPEALQAMVNIDDLLAGAQILQDFANASPGRNRVFASPGHNATVNYLFDELSALDYYDVSLQPFEALFSDGSESLTVNGADQNATLFTYTPSGSVNSTTIVAVSNLGCNSTDYPPSTNGSIALISRGVCPFGQKSALAGSAGAVGAVIYNNVPGNLAGTLGAASNPAGPYAPTVGIPLENGQALLAQLNSSSSPLKGDLTVNSILENRTTYNVLAQSRSGDQSSVVSLGAHTDSVSAGPGINDDGSGTIGLLNIARYLTEFSLTNSVRFGFWAAEEFGLLGSEFYVANLPAEELEKIRLYLNFDMIASPNYIYALYDGDGSSFNLTGPPGSDQIEALFQSYFRSRNLNFTASAFDGRSDYLPFIDAGVPAGGIFTGAEGIKTPAQQALFGGTAGVAFDENYHEAGDTIENLNLEAFETNVGGVAFALATYAGEAGLEGIPDRGVGNSTVTRRGVGKKRSIYRERAVESKHSHANANSNVKGGCMHSRVFV